MRIGILEAGALPDDLAPRWGRYGDLFRALLAGRGFDFAVWRAYANELPEGIEAADAWIVTGSRHAVYEDHPWLPRMEALVRAAHDARRPMAGLCFGHQLMAKALGGRVEKSPKGWGIGVHEWPAKGTEAEAEAPGGASLRLVAAHQDQVVEVPSGARVTAGSAFCPVAALEWPGVPLLAWQGHPEFDADFARALIATRRGAVYPEALADEALETLSTPLDRERVADRIAALFRDGA